MRFSHLPSLLTAALLALACHDVTGPESGTTPTAGPLFSATGIGGPAHGLGSVGTGAATPGASRQDFDYDIAVDLRSATLAYRDWSFVRGDGSTVTLNVSPSDRFTAISRFRDRSTACADPARGVEFDGWGRLDNGNLMPFTVVACDNGPAGNGGDSFRLSIPSAAYVREGLVSSGDVAKTGTLPPPASPQVTGQGWHPPGRPDPVTSYGKEFDFVATAAPSGRLVFRDWETRDANGTPFGFTANSQTDPATRVDFYHQLSATCVRFGGIGRISTGQLHEFWVDACDNASPGTGFDTFFLQVPSQFDRGGTLTAGDIVLGTPAPTTGDLNVAAATTGASLDPDGYTVTVDGSSSQPLPINGSVSFAGLSAGDHAVALSGVASNCTVSGGSSRTISVTAGATASTTFSVSCTPLPGSLTVTAATSGESLDPDGYTVTVDGGTSQPLGINGSVTFTDLSAGDHSVTVSGVAPNCTVTGGSSRTVTVTAGATATTTFSVSCTALPGDLTVTVATSGISLDLDGYTVTVDGANPRAVGINGSVTYASLPAGNHTVALSGVAPNCSVSGGSSRTVAVPAGGTISTNFSVTCVPGPATQLVFTGQPSNTKVNATIQPAVQVTALDAQGNRATSFNGSVTIAIGRNGGGLLPGTLSGTRTVNAANGVATFSDLRIDRAGDYTLRVTSAGLTGAESWVFQIQNLVCVLGVCL